MKRRDILKGLLATVAMPSAALAQTAEDQVVSQLKRQGYQRITLGRTLLGRTRIVATGPRGRREIILNPSTGAILRDYLDRSDDKNDNDHDDDGSDDDHDDAGKTEDDIDDDDNSGPGSSNSSRDKDENDDDDDDEDDNSGSGGGNDSDDDDDDDDDD